MVITQGAQIIKAFGVFNQALAAAVVASSPLVTRLAELFGAFALTTW